MARHTFRSILPPTCTRRAHVLLRGSRNHHLAGDARRQKRLGVARTTRVGEQNVTHHYYCHARFALVSRVPTSPLGWLYSKADRNPKVVTDIKAVTDIHAAVPFGPSSR